MAHRAALNPTLHNRIEGLGQNINPRAMIEQKPPLVYGDFSTSYQQNARPREPKGDRKPATLWKGV
ncbi:hypothetical protein AA3250_1909 [Gluconobacter albidus NBRC 3250]|nr:hypothetical protein AA3250_1909 [Gluconobacter albidus NBRC 3250]